MCVRARQKAQAIRPTLAGELGTPGPSWYPLAQEASRGQSRGKGHAGSQQPYHGGGALGGWPWGGFQRPAGRLQRSLLDHRIPPTCERPKDYQEKHFPGGFQYPEKPRSPRPETGLSLSVVGSPTQDACLGDTEWEQVCKE